ncbi:MAG: hypothetical protein ACLFVP_06740 [Candidatus Bathyarchaeia archaeon]
MSLLERLQYIDRRIIYLLAWLAVLVPLLNPIGLPITVGKYSSEYYDYIENFPEGSTIMVSFDYGVSAMPELYPLTVATFRHLWSHDFKVVVVATWQEGPMVMDILLNEIDPEQEYGKVYGEDWIELGWVPQSEIGMASLATDIWKAKPRDYIMDKPTSSFPIMQDIKTAEDIDLLVTFETGTPGLPEWLRQWQTPYDTPIILGCIGVMVPETAPFHQTGQLSALIPGLTASAEYEMLVKEPGLALASVDAISMSHLLVIVLVLVGNVAFFFIRREE